LYYKFSRKEKISPEYTAATLLFGSAIHKVMEDFYQAKLKGHYRTLEELHQSFAYHWQDKVESADKVRYKEGESFSTLFTLGKDLLSTWYENLPKDGYKVLAIENPFSFQLEGIDVPIIGVMDLIEQDESGNIIITDFKTSCRSYSKDDIDKNLQLTIYHMAAKRNGFADCEIILKFDCLIKTKKPKFEQYYTVRSEEDEQRMIRTLHEVWTGIQKQVFIPNDRSWKCGYCSFRKHCDHWFQQPTPVFQHQPPKGEKICPNV
jgi:putative RecB family exonuclease